MPVPHDDLDSALMRRVQRGDLTAFTELVERHRQAVMNFTTRLLQDANDAEDVAQGTFVQVFKHAHRYKPSARFTTWMFTIARNLCLNEFRRRARHPADSLDIAHPDHADRPLRQFEDTRVAPPTEAALRAELAAKVDEAIAGLPEAQRAALLLCRDGEMSYEEIALALGCSLSATKSVIFRARETLKRVLKPYLLTGEWLENSRQL